jgi:VIT1/CCC1 family predicted Fe2+/Mn2+ transporter
VESDHDAKRLKANLQGEVDSAALYRALADAEQSPALKSVYGRLAEVEEKHARFWQNRLRALGDYSQRVLPGRRTRLLSWLAQRFGPGFVLPSIASLEQVDSVQYDKQADAVSGGLPGVERSHARLLKAIAGPTPEGVAGGTLARLEGRHRGMGGNALRAAVLGANDGLVSNLSLVMGVAGAGAASGNILLTGVAGLIAGACSMAMGEWLSVNSSRELYEKQIATERHELEVVPDEEREELALIYEAKGLPREQAKALADHIMSDKTTALDTLAREELGIDPAELGGSPWLAAITSFGLFAFGAIFPVAPFIVTSGMTAVIASVVLSGAAMFAIGAATTIFTGRGVLFSGFRQLVIGCAAAAVTYGAGKLFGAALS